MGWLAPSSSLPQHPRICLQACPYHDPPKVAGLGICIAKGDNIHVDKSETAHTWPPTLILHINRFQRLERETIKLTQTIDAPTTFNLPDGPTYHLRATVRHHGNTPTSGHYVAAVATNTPPHGWLLCDDHKAPAPLRQPDTETRHAYLLFYAKGEE